MISEKTFYNVAFFYFLKIAMLLVNIYYFFFKLNSLPVCFSNLFKTFDKEMNLTAVRKFTWNHQRTVIEMLLVCYLGGA